MSAISLSDAMALFLHYQRYRRNASQSTLNTYKSGIEIFISHVGNMTVDELTIAHIDAYADHVASLGYKDKTYRNKLVVVRSFIRYLYAKEIVAIRPESVELPKMKEHEANFLDFDEQEQLLSSIEDCRTLAIVQILLRSGLRISELVDLRTDDLFERSIVVRKGKGGKPRVTFITQEAEEAIAKYLATKPYTRFMFTNIRGNQLSRQFIARVISDAGNLAGLRKHISPHTLRHTFATNMLREGARAEDIQPMMGHANIATTRMYLHFTNPYLKERYDKITSSKNLSM